MPELHLNQFGFTYSACDPLTKNNERIKKFMQTGNTDYIYKNDLDKSCFQHNMDDVEYNDVNKRTQSDKVLRDKAFEIAINPKYDVYHQLSNQLHKPIIIQFIRRKVYS